MSDTPITDAAEQDAEMKYQILYHSRKKRPVDSDKMRDLERKLSEARGIAESFRACAETKFGPMPFPRKFPWEVKS